MVDYTKSTGIAGTMMIRDTGTVVEFWLTHSSGNAPYNHRLPWASIINGVNSGWKYFNYTSEPTWKKLGSWTITTTQTVTFSLGDTQTVGLGGPTSLSANIQRSSAPPKPNPWLILNVTETSVTGRSSNNATGNLPLTRAEVGYGTRSTSPTNYKDVPISNPFVLNGLAKNTTYYFWYRLYNSKGVSPWSNQTSAHTKQTPPPPNAPVLTKATGTTVHSKFSGNGSGSSGIIKWQTGYGTNPTTPTQIVDGFDIEITGLTPGLTYYFWGRGQNSVGYGLWGARSAPLTFGCVWVYNSNGVPKKAVPYVKHNGVWKVAEARIKIAGLWKPGG